MTYPLASFQWTILGRFIAEIKNARDIQWRDIKWNYLRFNISIGIISMDYFGKITIVVLLRLRIWEIYSVRYKMKLPEIWHFHWHHLYFGKISIVLLLRSRMREIYSGRYKMKLPEIWHFHWHHLYFGKNLPRFLARYHHYVVLLLCVLSDDRSIFIILVCGSESDYRQMRKMRIVNVDQKGRF